MSAAEAVAALPMMFVMVKAKVAMHVSILIRYI